MARQTKPAVRDAWANAVSASPDIEESVYPDTGFPAPAGVPVVPTRGEFNFEFNRYDRGMSYLFQHGVADWDTDETDYAAFDVLRDPGDGKLYQLIGTATPTTAPSADPTNWYLFHRVPRPMSGETVEDEIAAWYNAKGFRITGKDHFGFDAGRILDIREDWIDSAATKTATGGDVWFGRWLYGIDNSGGTAGSIALMGPYNVNLNTRPWGPLVTVKAVGSGVHAVSVVEMTKAIVKMSAASLVLECDFSINGASDPGSNSSFAVGLADGTLAANLSMGAVDLVTAYGAWVEATGFPTTWGVTTKPIGGGGTSSSTGVTIARDNPNRWRCVIVGTSDSDDSVARVYHFINGALVGTGHLNSLNNQMLTPFIRCYGNQTEACSLSVGPMRIQARLALGDGLF